MKAVDALMQELHVEEPRRVASPDGTRPADYRNGDSGAPLVLDADVHNLFGASKGYTKYKSEKPQHRLMLWLRLNGHNNKEIAQILGCSPQTVCNVGKQEWFMEAFCRISTEMGKDMVETFLEGEILPTMQKLVSLRDGAETDAVKLAASNAILDRIRGKPVARTETKITGSVDNVVYDVAALLEEQKRNAQILASRGIGTSNN